MAPPPFPTRPHHTRAHHMPHQVTVGALGRRDDRAPWPRLPASESLGTLSSLSFGVTWGARNGAAARKGCGALRRVRANVAATRRQAGIDLEGPVRVYDIFAQQVREALLSGRGRGHNRSPRPSALRTHQTSTPAQTRAAYRPAPTPPRPRRHHRLAAAPLDAAAAASAPLLLRIIRWVS